MPPPTVGGPAHPAKDQFGEQVVERELGIELLECSDRLHYGGKARRQPRVDCACCFASNRDNVADRCPRPGELAHLEQEWDGGQLDVRLEDADGIAPIRLWDPQERAETVGLAVGHLAPHNREADTEGASLLRFVSRTEPVRDRHAPPLQLGQELLNSEGRAGQDGYVGRAYVAAVDEARDLVSKALRLRLDRMEQLHAHVTAP